MCLQIHTFLDISWRKCSIKMIIWRYDMAEIMVRVPDAFFFFFLNTQKHFSACLTVSCGHVTEFWSMCAGRSRVCPFHSAQEAPSPPAAFSTPLFLWLSGRRRRCWERNPDVCRDTPQRELISAGRWSWAPTLTQVRHGNECKVALYYVKPLKMFSSLFQQVAYPDW